MGFKDKNRQAVAEKRAEKAQEAWDAGRRGYVLVAPALTGASEGALTALLDEHLAIGWKLHSTAAYQATGGLNSEKVVFTFLRGA